MGPEELLGIARQIQKPDPLLDVVLVRLLVPFDPGPDLGLFLTPIGDVAAVERLLDLPVQLVQVDLVDAVLRLCGLGPRSKAVLERLFTREYISAREISRLAGASCSGVLKALDRFSIQRDQDRPAAIVPVPFGFDYLNHRLIKNSAEEGAIRMMRE